MKPSDKIEQIAISRLGLTIPPKRSGDELNNLASLVDAILVYLDEQEEKVGAPSGKK